MEAGKQTQNMTLKILVLEPPNLTNVGYWRCWLPFQAIKAMYANSAVNFEFTYKRKDLTFEDAWNADVVVAPRPGSKPDVSEFLEKAKDNGARIILDLDDHIFGLPDAHQLYFPYSKGAPQYESAMKAIELADLFWFSTPIFMETYAEKFKKPGLVVPNAIPPEWLPEAPAPDRGLWSWRGRDIQVHDLIYAGWDWYEEIKDRPKQWIFLGWKPPLRHSNNTQPVPYIDDVQKYLLNVRKSGFNGIWKPMIDCPFNDHKSNIAWIEATMSGGVCLTNYAGKPGWEYSTKDFPTYKQACELWEKSKAEIKKNYNLYQAAAIRARSMIEICSHLLPTSPDTEKT